MSKWIRPIAVSLFYLVLAGSIACSPLGGDKEEVIQQPAEVVRGNLTVSVSSSGNLEVANEVKLAFGTGGKIDEIYIEEGDEVGKGEALAKLDTDALELALIQAQVAQTQAQVAQSQAQVAQSQAQVALEAAKFDLDRMEDVQEVKDDIEEAEWEVKIAEMRLREAVQSKSAKGDIGYWVGAVAEAQLKLLEAQEDLAELLAEDEYASLIVDEVKIKALQVEAAEQSLEQTKQSVEQAKLSVEQAKKSVEQAQRQLDEATITAPFDGLIASVDAKEGDIIPSPSFSTQTIIHLIDPVSMELKVDVDEIDIPGVKLKQKAIISLDALPDVQFEGKITFISSIPSPEAGVVLYEVKISFDVPPDSELKVGMSATADIIVNERSNVLLVPNRAIAKDSQGNPMVKVMVDEQIEEWAVVPGISDDFQTEIVDGLKEGDVVIEEAREKAKSAGMGCQAG